MGNRIFKRKIYERMLKWKRESNGNTALLIKGARRIGKSTIAETFARQEYESYIDLLSVCNCRLFAVVKPCERLTSGVVLYGC